MRKPDAAYRLSLLRSAAGIAGDAAVAAALIQTCLWITQAASLRLFLQFMLWLLAALIALAVSQYLVHPVVNVLLADDKLTRAGRAFAQMRSGIGSYVTPAAKNAPWGDVLTGLSRLKARHL